ncbi:MAG: bifunctional diaminohydroxyphosphoribosylaminopyrimidine deaminase/5-amino-6-(5-phosphoribosylamino)uracil reductase RibD [Planctomycetales bacterium]
MNPGRTSPAAEPLLETGHRFSEPAAVMRYALQLAARGEGDVEPNPMVGAVIVDSQLRLVGQGWHEKFGGPHAEVNAFASAREIQPEQTLYVTLEPCCHTGKTPPCTEAILKAGIRHVVVAQQDPFPEVAGKGIERLRAAGVTVEVGLLQAEARELNAPFRALIEQKRPYVHAKWAMTWDGKISSRTGSSQWISNTDSRRVVHQLRGRMDGILVGVGTVRADDPLLTARPAGPRTAVRIVLDPRATLPLESQLLTTIEQAPVLCVVGETAKKEKIAALQDAGVEVVTLPFAGEGRLDLRKLMGLLAERRMTNLLVEGGGVTLGHVFDEGLIDEAHVFLGPKLIGGEGAGTPIGGKGLPQMEQAFPLEVLQTEVLAGDVYLRGRVKRS